MDTTKMVFVFGSNEAGIHGAGAARFALDHRGAVWGQGEGPMGQSYGIPTKGGSRNSVGKTLPLNIIKSYVDRFIRHARHNHRIDFQITCIGCGLAGLKHGDIAPMFKDAPSNCYFDTLWQPYFEFTVGGRPKKYWGTF